MGYLLALLLIDSGHVLKVVFATDENGDIEPVIVEDIEVCTRTC